MATLLAKELVILLFIHAVQFVVSCAALFFPPDVRVFFCFNLIEQSLCLLFLQMGVTYFVYLSMIIEYLIDQT